MKNIRACAVAACMLLLGACAPNGEYQIRIDASALADTASSAVLYGFVPADEDFGEIAAAEVLEGYAVIEGQVGYIRNVSLDLLPADSNYPLGRAEFVLEPGVTKVVFLDGSTDVEGGEYTQIAYDSWRRDPGYRAADEKARKRRAAYVALSEEEKDALRDESGNRTTGLGQDAYRPGSIQSRILRKTYTAHEDPIARFVALDADRGWSARAQLLGDDLKEAFARAFVEQIEFHEAMERALPENPVVAFAANRIRDSHQRYLTSSAIAIGTTIKDFHANSIDGQPFRLKNVLADNEYVLVEFWASWCGPCRAEIPHMKEAYEKHRDSGFEIVSVSLDEELEDWQEASAEEEIPWIDTGDQKGFDSDVAKLYGVAGIPANYLVKGADGEILDRNLRQKRLDEKLAELYRR